MESRDKSEDNSKNRELFEIQEDNKDDIIFKNKLNENEFPNFNKKNTKKKNNFSYTYFNYYFHNRNNYIFYFKKKVP